MQTEEKIKIHYLQTPYGELILGSFLEKLCLCDWRYRKMRTALDNRIQKGIGTTYEEGNSNVMMTTISQLNEYFNRQRKTFDIPLLLVGTDFQTQVWNALQQIPFGTTESYQGLSERIHNIKAVRAVAAANGANALSIIVPCHRIIGSSGQLVGYAGGLPAKKKLLELESVNLVKQSQLFD